MNSSKYNWLNSLYSFCCVYFWHWGCTIYVCLYLRIQLSIWLQLLNDIERTQCSLKNNNMIGVAYTNKQNST